MSSNSNIEGQILKDKERSDNLGSTCISKITRLIKVPLLLQLYLWLGYIILIIIIYYEVKLTFFPTRLLDSAIKAFIPIAFIGLWLHSWLYIIRTYRRRKLSEITR